MTTRDPLTAEQIDAMPASRDMDAFVAERIMGWPCFISEEGNAILEHSDDPCPNFSTDIAAAMDIAHKFELFALACEHGEYQFRIHDVFPGSAGVRPIIGRADIAPLAICRAALKTVMF